MTTGETTPHPNPPPEGEGKYFLSEIKVLLPLQGEGWDGGGSLALEPRILLLVLKNFRVVPCASVAEMVF